MKEGTVITFNFDSMCAATAAALGPARPPWCSCKCLVAKPQLWRWVEFIRWFSGRCCSQHNQRSAITTVL